MPMATPYGLPSHDGLKHYLRALEADVLRKHSELCLAHEKHTRDGRERELVQEKAAAFYAAANALAKYTGDLAGQASQIRYVVS